MALVAVGLAVAVVSALLGLTMLGVADDAAADRRVAENTAGQAGVEVHERGLGTRIGERVLGIEDARAYYDAVRVARSASLPGLDDADVLQLRAQAEAILVRIVRGSANPPLRSAAANLLGTLLFEDAKIARQNPRRFLEQAAGAFQDAVVADPTNVAAKHNLELLSTLPLRTEFRKKATPGSEASASGGDQSGY